MTTTKTKKPKKEWSKKEPEVFHYFNAKGEKLWGYRHRYYDALGKRTEKTGQGLSSENVAIRKLLEVKSALINGNVKKVDNSNLTISEWLDIWFETYQGDWEVTSKLQRKNAIKYQMKPLLGKEKLMTLDKSTYKRKFIDVLLKDYKPGTVLLLHRLFKIAINAAVEDEIIPRNRFNNIKIETGVKKDNFLNADELALFLRTAKELENITNYTAILTLAYTGLRRGELQGLKWSDIDLKEKQLTVERTRDKHGPRTPKTKKSYRTIIIDDLLVKQLESYRKWCIEKKLSIGKQHKKGDYVFISDQGGTPIGDNTLNYSFRRIIKECRVRKITPHGLRHSHATILISRGIPLQTITDRLGNTPEMILQVYGHPFKELEIASVEAFSVAMSEALN
jgi:integrase